MERGMLLLSQEEVAHGGGEGAGVAADVVDGAHLRVLALPRARLALELLIDLVNHADAAGPDGVAK